MIKNLLDEYIKNFKKLEKITKEETKTEKEKQAQRTEQNEMFYKLQDKIINGEQYTQAIEKLRQQQEETEKQNELLKIERLLLQDNENIIIDKIIIDIFKNILIKYNNKAIGESITQKIDNEIKDYLKPIYNEKYITKYEYNTFRNYTPNQLLNIYGSDYSFSNYQKKLCFNLTSIYGARNEYKITIYLKNNKMLLNEYSKTEEETEADNKKTIERVENTETIQDTKKKAKEIYKAYKKKNDLLEKIRKQQEQIKTDFDNTIKTNQETFFHKLYNYFYR